ncbi:Hpt domain-containing protein [Deltaproteobacteria bacterium TL4]
MNFSGDEEVLLSFKEETRLHLSEIETGILQLEGCQESSNADIINTMFRAAHSIKAGANLLNLKNIGQLSHKLENILQLFRQGTLVFNTDLVNLVLEAIDILRVLLEDLEAGKSLDISKVLTQLSKYS